MSRHPKPLQRMWVRAWDAMIRNTGTERNAISNRHTHCLSKPLQTPSSIVSYLNNGPTINCRCGFIFATLKFLDLSVAVIDEIDCGCELDVNGGMFGSVSVCCWA